MRFGGEVDDQACAVDRPPSGLRVGDIAFDEVQINSGQAPPVAGVGETVEHAHPPSGAVAPNGSHEVGADESGGAGYENGQRRARSAGRSSASCSSVSSRVEAYV